MKHLTLREADWLEIEREGCRRSLAVFARMAWHIMEPATALKWGWALDAICQHLQAVTDGQFNKLLMNVPPGMMKSLLTGVIWPAWEWGPRGLKHMRHIGAAHKQDLAVRDAMKCRRLIQSQWYQDRWPTNLVTDQNAKTKFENDKTGFVEAMAFTSMTGSRGDRVKLDDPLSADDANSDAALRAAEITFTEGLPTRVNNEKSAIVVIMQRLHERDTSGVILDKDLGYVHLCLPMRFEPGRKCTTPIFTDPRQTDGELLFHDRFPETQVSDLERTMGSYASAGQLQQRPSPRGGGMFKQEWFGVVQAAPATCKWARGWDLAGTKSDTAAYTAGVLMGRDSDGLFYIKNVTRDRVDPVGVKKMLVNTASQDGRDVPGSIPQDPGSAGKSWGQELIRALAGYVYTMSPETGDKATRALPLAAQAEAGNVKLVAGSWNRDFLEEISMFPVGKYKDQTDAASRAFDMLVAPASQGIEIETGFY